VAAAQANVPAGTFRCHNLGEENLSLGTGFDVVFAIDVTQHVVEKRKLMTFLRNMQGAAKPGGLIFVTSYVGWGDRSPGQQRGIEKLVPAVRFVALWDRDTIASGLPEGRLVHVGEFWDKAMLVFRRRPKSETAFGTHETANR